MTRARLSRSFLGVLVLISTGCSAGKTINGSLVHDGVKREFILYLPEGSTGASPLPLVLNLHGYTSDATEQMWYGDFRSVADSAGFIIVHPQGTKYQGKTHWNTGGWTPGSIVDDLGFLNRLIDHLAAQYKVDPQRIYAVGMSNGGEMAYHLACNSSNRIAAIASVSGSMTPETYRGCHPARPIPVLHIHGTDDHVVPYQGDPTATPVAKAMEYWARHNGCDRTPTLRTLPDTSQQDKSSVEHASYRCGTITTELFRVIGGDHAWPGSAFKLPGTNNDMNASAEIWKFFDRYDLGGLRR